MMGTQKMHEASVLVLFSLVLLPLALAYSTGAPESACEHMVPSHGAAPQNSASPYTITTAFIQGGQVRVTISGSDGFKGFLLLARSTDGSTVPVGKFMDDNHDDVQFIHHESAATHKQNNLKTTVTVHWSPPANGVAGIEFVATIVENHQTFWTGVKSAAVSFSGDFRCLQQGGQCMSTAGGCSNGIFMSGLCEGQDRQCCIPMK